MWDESVNWNEDGDEFLQNRTRLCYEPRNVAGDVFESYGNVGKIQNFPSQKFKNFFPSSNFSRNFRTDLQLK